MKRALAAVFMAAAAVAALAVPAGAEVRERIDFELDLLEPYAACEPTTVVIERHLRFSVSVTRESDDPTSPVIASTIHGFEKFTLINPESGATLTGGSTGTTRWEGELVQTSTGLHRRLIVPGVGPVELAGGRIVVDYTGAEPVVTFDAGPEGREPFGDTAAICAALA